MKKNKHNKTIPITFRVNKRLQKKLNKIQSKFRMRDYSKTIRHLIEKEEV